MTGDQLAGMASTTNKMVKQGITNGATHAAFFGH